MDKRTKETIQEVIEEILDIRKAQVINDWLEKNAPTSENAGKRTKAHSKHKHDVIYKQLDNTLVKLNGLLSKKDQYLEVLDIEEQMRKMQAKKYITRKEFADIYNISISSQDVYRGRLYDPLPYHQKVAGGKVVYVVDEVEKWFANQHK